MVECQLPKLDVAGSTPVSRSIKIKHLAPPVLLFCTPLYSIYITNAPKREEDAGLRGSVSG